MDRLIQVSLRQLPMLPGNAERAVSPHNEACMVDAEVRKRIDDAQATSVSCFDVVFRLYSSLSGVVLNVQLLVTWLVHSWLRSIQY